MSKYKSDNGKWESIYQITQLRGEQTHTENLQIIVFEMTVGKEGESPTDAYGVMSFYRGQFPTLDEGKKHALRMAEKFGDKVAPPKMTKTKRVNRGRSNRRKGHQFEREVAKLFRRWFPEARRGLQYRDGAECCDVEGTPYWIECKRRKKSLNWLDTFKSIKGDGRPVLLVWKLDRKPIYVARLGFNSEWKQFESNLAVKDRPT